MLQAHLISFTHILSHFADDILADVFILYYGFAAIYFIQAFRFRSTYIPTFGNTLLIFSTVLAWFVKENIIGMYSINYNFCHDIFIFSIFHYFSLFLIYESWLRSN